MHTSASSFPYRISFLVLAACLIGLVFTVFISSPQSARAGTTFTVDTTSDTSDANPGDGLCADSSGNCSLRAAIEEANALAGADAITLPAGTYYLDNGQLWVTDDLSLEGESAETTIIDGKNNARIFKISEEENPILVTVSIAGVTIQKGNSSRGAGIWNAGVLTLDNSTIQNNSANNYGGGIYNEEGGVVTITNSLLTNNSSGVDGGGIYNYGFRDSLLISNSTISNNSASDDGGGLDSLGGTVIQDSLIMDNSAGDEGGGISNHYIMTITQSTISTNGASNGGGIFHSSFTSQLTIIDSTLDNNSSFTGGGLHVDNGAVALINSSLTNNTASSGGGIYNESPYPDYETDVTLTHITIRDNRAYEGGGIYNATRGNLTLVSSTLSGNEASNDGGGIYSEGGSITLYNSTLSGNLAEGDGGGLYLTTYYAGPSNVDITHSTIAENVADYLTDGSGDGGGVFIQNGTLTLRNTILAGNSDSGGEAPDCAGDALNSADYNLIEDTAGCTLTGSVTHNLTDLPADLAPLADNGGDTMTHALLPDSPAIDTGICTDISGTPVTEDQRGFPRPMGLSCDIGAYEVEGGSLQKSVNQVNPFPGQRITYTINAINTTTATLTNALISDTLPSGLTFAGPITLEPPDAGTPGTAPPTLVSNLTISPGEEITVTFPVTVNVDVPPGTHITNTASLEVEGMPEPASGSSTITICGNTITVTSNADDGPGSLREAIANLCTGGRIEFNLTTPTTITLTSGELLIDKAMTIAGPGAEALNLNGDNASRVFKVSGTGVTISGLTIRNGRVLGEDGGGIHNTGVLTIAASVFISNSVEVFHYPYGGGGGGAVYNSGVLLVTDSQFYENQAYTSGGGGGGIHNQAGVLTITHSLFEGNAATGYYGYGGAVHNADYEGITTIDRSTFFNNTAENSGGALNNFYGDFYLSNSTVYSNTALLYDGGALNVDDGTLYLANSTFSGNYANNDGGAIWVGYAYLFFIDNLTFSGNIAASEGNAIYSEGGTIKSRNTIFAGNGEGFNCVQGSWEIDSLGYNLSDDGSCDLDHPTDLSAVEPLLGPLADNGGDTLTHALLPGSPAIDAGSCTDSTGEPILTDQRGAARPQGVTCDIGAFEYEFLAPLLVKKVNNPLPQPGQRITYTINAINAITTTLTNTLISDTLPSGLTFAGPITLEPPDAGTPGTAPPILASNLTISPGEKITLTFPVTLNLDVPPGTHITNTASLEPEGLPPLASGSSTITACGEAITVTSSADDGPGSLREAIANLCAGGRIEFNLTTPTTITLTSGELLIDRAMTIAGPGAEALTLDGDNASRIFKVSGTGVTISGLTIRNGWVSEDDGGGIHNTGVLTVAASAFVSNRVDIVYTPDKRGGGAIYNSGRLLVTDSQFYENEAYNSGTDGGGGGIFNQAGVLTITHSLFESNAATGHSGIVGSYGGALYNAEPEGILTIDRSSFFNNTAETSGGAFNNDEGDFYLTNSAVYSNTALIYDGGALYITGGNTYLANSTFSGNFANRNGGAFWANTPNQFFLDNLTLSDKAASEGNEFYLLSGFGTIKSKNTIFASTSSEANCVLGSWEIESLGYNLSDDDSCGLDHPTDLSGVAPLLGPLADNGGDTLTRALSPDSPAIEAGSCTDIEGMPITSDQRGVTRPRGVSCDIGAFEYEFLAPIPAKSVSKPLPYPGQRITYTITVLNLMTDTLTNVLISDTLPSGLTFAGPITLEPPDAGTPGTAPPTLASNLTINLGEKITVTLPITVNADLPAGAVLTNTAAISGSGVFTPVFASATITVTKPPTPTKTRLVSPTGTDTGDCTVDQCATIGYALSQAADGDIISIASGTYTETLTVDKSVFIKGSGQYETIIQAASESWLATSRVMTVTADAEATIADLTIRHGYAAGSAPDNYGGGIYNQGTLTLTNTIISGNAADPENYTYGGGIYNTGNLIVTSSIVSNSTAYSGGGIYNAGVLTMTETTLTSNQATDGGGIYNQNGVLTVKSSAIIDNQASNAGGGIQNSGVVGHGQLTLINSTISGNQAAAFGGGIYYSCFMGDSPLALIHTTVANNIADSDGDGNGSGGGLVNDCYQDTSIQNTIIAANTDRSGQAPDCGGEIVSFDYNLIGNASGCTFSGQAHDQVGDALTPIDALLGHLKDNGGKTPTHALLYGSPAIDAGSCTDSEGMPITSDQRGVARPQGTTCDIGAFEFVVEPSLTKTVDDALPLPYQMITYTITIRNNNQITATYSALTDNLPGGLTFVGPITLEPTDAGTPGTAPPTLASNLTINPGEKITLTFPVTVNAGLPAGTVLTNTAAITISGVITPVSASAAITIANAVPTAADDGYTTTVDAPLEVPAPGLLENDVDLNSDPLSAVLDQAPPMGSLTLNPDGSFTYTPTLDYIGVVTFTYHANDGSASSNTAVVSITVHDSDGVDDDIENAAPNQGDGNNDGIPDSEQPNVASLPNVYGDYVTLVAPADILLENVQALDNPSQETAPSGVDFPQGFFSFTADGLAAGESITVTIILHAGDLPNSFWKYGPTQDDPSPHWYEFTFDGITGAVFNGNRLTLHFQDGARGDADLAANGTIADPGAPAIRTQWTVFLPLTVR